MLKTCRKAEIVINAGKYREMATKIEWAEETWNPITGCTKISEGCQNCYAEKMSKRLAGRYGYPKDEPFRPGVEHPKALLKTFKANERVFVCSMGDLFHENVNIRGDAHRAIFRHMASMDAIFILLTKRPERMAKCIDYLYGNDFAEILPNVWVGTTAENQKRADERIPILTQIPASVLFVSFEPLLSGIDMVQCGAISCGPCSGGGDTGPVEYDGMANIDWAIVGGESGHNARPMNPEWVRSLQGQCSAFDIPFMFKQWGEWSPEWHHVSGPKCHRWNPDEPGVLKVGKKKAGRMLDGKIWNQYPTRNQ